jgi:sugar O-acyltransferase (sialic acid O-acetyltransferase NeuD family)
MPPKQAPIVIVGDGEFAEIACDYFTHDSPYEVAAFAVERAFRRKDELFGRPVVDFEDVEARFPPETFGAFVAVTFTQLNRVRARLFAASKAKGYKPVSYVSSRAFVWHNVTLGENCFVFEGAVVQRGARVGDGVVLWSGSQVLHRASVGDFCFFSAGAVVAGYSEVGPGCFLGVNASVGDRVRVGRDGVIGAGAVVTRDTLAGKVYKGARAVGPCEIDGRSAFKAPAAA